MGALLVLLLLIGLGAALLPGRWPHENADTATIHSLAVIPLENLSDDSEQEYFVDGLTDELIASIAKISQLRVISRTSVMRYKGARRPIAEIARELKVDGIVEGTVLRSGDRVRITAQLIEARTDKHLWGETYYGDLRDILTLQTQVTKAIASEVRIKVAPQRMEVAHQVNPEAYELYLKGRSYADRLTPASRGAATRYYERSIELDPNFALANAFLAESLVLAQADEASRKDLPRARAAINRALELDPTLSSAHTLLGMIHLSWEWDWAGAERECKRALELNPNDWAAHYGYAYYLHVINRPQEALAESNRALEFDPFSPRTISQKAYMLDYLHRHEEANQLYRRTLELDPGFERARYGLLWNDFRADLQSKNYVEAKHAIEIIIGKRSPLGGTTRNSVQPLRNILESNHDRSGLGILQTASAYSLLGDRDRAMQCLEQAFASRLRALNELVSNPDWEPLHSDPRFRAMANRMNLPLPN